MATLNKRYESFLSHVEPAGAWRRFTAEVAELLKALASPSSVIAEVEEMQSLRAQADKVQAHDPELAASLRQRASLIGLR